VKPESDQRLSDHISLGVLTRVFPPEVVDEILEECGRLERRHRLLPARVVVYYVLGLALFSSSSYEEVMRMLVSGHSWASGSAQNLCRSCTLAWPYRSRTLGCLGISIDPGT
jgi:hypothetical protein